MRCYGARRELASIPGSIRALEAIISLLGQSGGGGTMKGASFEDLKGILPEKTVKTLIESTDYNLILNTRGPKGVLLFENDPVTRYGLGLDSEFDLEKAKASAENTSNVRKIMKVVLERVFLQDIDEKEFQNIISQVDRYVTEVEKYIESISLNEPNEELWRVVSLSGERMLHRKLGRAERAKSEAPDQKEELSSHIAKMRLWLQACSRFNPVACFDREYCEPDQSALTALVRLCGSRELERQPVFLEEFQMRAAMNTNLTTSQKYTKVLEFLEYDLDRATLTKLLSHRLRQRRPKLHLTSDYVHDDLGFVYDYLNLPNGNEKEQSTFEKRIKPSVLSNHCLPFLNNPELKPNWNTQIISPDRTEEQIELEIYNIVNSIKHPEPMHIEEAIEAFGAPQISDPLQAIPPEESSSDIRPASVNSSSEGRASMNIQSEITSLNTPKKTSSTRPLANRPVSLYLPYSSTASSSSKVTFSSALEVKQHSDETAATLRDKFVASAAQRSRDAVTEWNKQFAATARQSRSSSATARQSRSSSVAKYRRELREPSVDRPPFVTSSKPGIPSLDQMTPLVRSSPSRKSTRRKKASSASRQV